MHTAVEMDIQLGPLPGQPQEQRTKPVNFLMAAGNRFEPPKASVVLLVKLTSAS